MNANNPTIDQNATNSTPDTFAKMHGLIDKIKDFYTSVINDLNQKYSNNFTHLFETNLTKAKGGVIFFLILISIIYHVNYGHLPYSKTYLQSQFVYRALIDSLVTGLLGLISISFMMYMRYGNVLKHWKGPVIVALILFLFNFVQESSGLNRYLDKKNIEEGQGNYAEIDKIITSDDSDALYQVESGGDPFWNSVGYLSMSLIGLVLVYYFSVMVISTIYGYKSGKFGINTIDYYGLSFIKNNYVKFGVELLIIAVLNSMAYIISPVIRGDMGINGIISKVYLCKAGIMFTLMIIMQYMFQWSGMIGGNQGSP